MSYEHYRIRWRRENGLRRRQDLANDQRVDSATIADLNLEAAKTVADYISSPKIHIEKVDIKKEGELVGALKGADVCLNATVYYTNLEVMHACLQAGVHYTNMGGLFHTTRSGHRPRAFLRRAQAAPDRDQCLHQNHVISSTKDSHIPCSSASNWETVLESIVISWKGHKLCMNQIQDS
jgi:hypothetical protein